MLNCYYELSDLRFMELMSVYEESNRLNARELYPGMDRNAALLQVEQNFYQYLAQVFFSVQDAVYCVWEERNRYISALRLEPYEDGFLLEALETAPDERGRGCATKLILSVENMVEAPIYSHVHKENVPSLNVHKKCDFRLWQDFAQCIDGSLRHDMVTFRFEKGK